MCSKNKIAFIKNDRHILESFLMATARKSCFCFTDQEKETYHILISGFPGQVGKTIAKYEKYIVFPESQYINSNPHL